MPTRSYKAQGYFRDIADAKPDEELLELAEALIEKKTAKFDPASSTTAMSTR